MFCFWARNGLEMTVGCQFPESNQKKYLNLCYCADQQNHFLNWCVNVSLKRKHKSDFPKPHKFCNYSNQTEKTYLISLVFYSNFVVNRMEKAQTQRERRNLNNHDMETVIKDHLSDECLSFCDTNRLYLAFTLLFGHVSDTKNKAPPLCVVFWLSLTFWTVFEWISKTHKFKGANGQGTQNRWINPKQRDAR